MNANSTCQLFNSGARSGVECGALYIVHQLILTSIVVKEKNLLSQT